MEKPLTPGRAERSQAESAAIDRLLAEAPFIKDLPSDPEWEKVESAMAARAFKTLAPFEE